MPAYKGIYFGGRGIIKPGAYAVVDTSRMVPNRLSPANTGGAIGAARGGDPTQVLTFNSISEARKVLREGALLGILEKAYNPSGDVQGAGEIQCVRVGEAVQSSIALLENGGNDVITLTSRDYGLLQNLIRVKVEAGTLGGIALTVQDVSEDRPAIEIGDNLGPLFTIEYTGTADECLFTIGLTGDVATTLTLSTSGAGTPVPTDDISLDLSLIQYNTVQKVAEVLDQHASYVVTKEGGADLSMPIGKMDAVTAFDLAGGTQDVTAALGSIEHWADRFSELVTAERVASETEVPDELGFTYMAGGTEGAAPDINRWAECLTLLEDVDIDTLMVASEESTVQAAAIAHCEAMSDVKAKRERRLVCGLTAGSNDDDAVQRALELTSTRCTVVYPGIKVLNADTGATEIVGGMYSAALVAGMMLGNPPAFSPTNKTIRVVGLEKNLDLTSIERLLNAGVTPLEFRANGGAQKRRGADRDGTFRVVQGLTTYLRDANTTLRKIIGMRVADYVKRNMRNAVEQFIGEVGDKTAIQSIRNATIVMLNNLTRTPSNPAGVLTPGVDEYGGDQPAWRNLVVDYDGQELVNITVDVSPVGEIAYITITATFIPNRIRLA